MARQLTTTLPLVRVLWDEKARCALVCEGPEVSEIKWLTSGYYLEPGHRQFIPNGQWKLVKGKTVEVTTRAPKAAVSSNGAAPAGAWSYAPDATIGVTGANPQKSGTAIHARWQKVWDHAGKRWEAYRDAGGNPDTLRNAIKKGLVRVS